LLAKVVQGELWYSFNPDLETDPVYQRFIVNHPEDAVVVKMNWDDNPWFSEMLRAEKNWIKAHDPERYRVVWEGFCRRAQ
jgi:phage terminase large subunit